MSKEKGCEIIGSWRKAFYWSVTFNKKHLEEVKLAKFPAFLSQVLNKHSNLPNRLFNALAHGIVVAPSCMDAQR